MMVHKSDSGAKMEARSKVEQEMSLAALRRNDPYVSGIMDVSGQVALYSFSAKANEWEKTDIEGTLFVYARSASPQHGFTIMNRLNMNNLVEPINKDLEFQLHEPFLLYRNSSRNLPSLFIKRVSARGGEMDFGSCPGEAEHRDLVFGSGRLDDRSGEDRRDWRPSHLRERHTAACNRLSIYSIWFYDMSDCQRIAKLMTQVVQQESAKVKNRKSPLGTNGCSTRAIDILEMLSKAKNEYEKGQGNDFSCSLKNTPFVRTESLDTPEQVSSSAPQNKAFQTVPKHLTVEELFGTTLSKDQHITAYPTPEINDPFLSDVGECNVFRQSKPIQPVIVKAEARSFNCSASDFSHPACLAPAVILQGPVTQLDSQKVNTFPGHVSPSLGPSSDILNTSAPHNSSLIHARQMSPLISQSVSDVGSVPHTQPLLPPLAPMRSSSFSSTSHPSVDLLQKLKLNPQVSTLPPPTMSKTIMAPKFSCSTSQLATPECFKDSSLKGMPSGPLQNAHEKRAPETCAQPLGVSKVVAASQFGAPTTTDAASVLWSPSVFQQPATKHGSQDERAVTPPLINRLVDGARSCCSGSALSRPQLQETLVHLIKNDASFLKTIHEAYLQVVTKNMDNVKL